MRGFKTVHIADAPMQVAVHEAMDVLYQKTPHRYFITVDFKFKSSDALNIGKLGWFGCTKSEAVKEANILANAICSAAQTLNSAKEYALNNDTFTNRYTVKMQEERLNKLVGKYNATIMEN